MRPCRIFLEATRLEPEWPKASFSLAKALRRQGRSDEAIAAYQRTLQLKPDYAEAHLELGGVYFEQHRYAEAIDQYRELLRLRPDSVDAWINIGGVFFAEGRLDEALPYYEQALRLQSSSRRCPAQSRKAPGGEGGGIVTLVCLRLAATSDETRGCGKSRDSLFRKPP